jgi:hypothetical protein
VEELNDEWFHDGVKASWRRALSLARGVRMKQFLPGHETLAPKCRTVAPSPGVLGTPYPVLPGSLTEGLPPDLSATMTTPLYHSRIR